MKNKNSSLIITMKLGSNYGGIIQAYALQSFIKKFGSKVFTSTPTKSSKIRRRIGDIKRSISSKNNQFVPNLQEENLIFTNTKNFIKSNIDTINIYDKLGKINPKINNFSNIIVGSDQVWRANYVTVPDYLLDFVSNDNTKKISYAASFGKDDLSEYNPELIKRTAILAKKFDAISVREDSGVNICKEKWDVDAVQLVDPTLLIQKEEYIELIENDKTMESNGDLFVYILDRSGDKQTIVDMIAKKLNLKPFEIMPPTCNSRKEFHKNSQKFTLPPVTQWLRSFMDAKFIITDSFHGCVFSIIFNKPFIAIGNEGRGLTRFTSLLKVFKLENRLVLDSSDLTDDLISSNIDWTKVNDIIKFEQTRSSNFLKENCK